MLKVGSQHLMEYYDTM